MSAVERIDLNDFEANFSSSTGESLADGTFTELSSVALGGRVVAVSDEFFAEAFHLLLVEPAPSLKGQFGPNGALYSGWETRRHNPDHDWCIIQLGTTGSIAGFDVDTSNFNGNEAPAVSVHALYDADLKDPTPDDPRWTEILPKSILGPNSRHLFKVTPTPCYNYVILRMYPDGGIARFRVYGKVLPVHPPSDHLFDLAHVFAGGRVLRVSDQHFGVGANLILPGRGVNMGDGWETKRSRTKGHNDWVVIQLGVPGELTEIELDTHHFLGNFPESCEIYALSTRDGDNWNNALADHSKWTMILPRTKLGPHRQHFFELENVVNKTYTHVKVIIFPDGGLKRIRIMGRRADEPIASTSQIAPSLGIPTPSSTPMSDPQSQIFMIPVVPLTAEAFAPFGQVIQAYRRNHPARATIKVTAANGGTAEKFHKQSLPVSTYPPEAGASTGISVYRCEPLTDISDGITVLRTLERHPYTNQAFIPMGSGTAEGLEDPANAYLVVVAHNGSNDKPDMKTLRAFVATTSQGISYNAGIWHQPMTVLGKPLDLACVENQIGDGSQMDCEILDLDPASTYILKFSQGF